MPKIALVKTSSMGDVIHNLPVVSDILFHYPNSEIHWVVEEAFSEIPAMHPGVRKVIPLALRRWRKKPFAATNRQEMQHFRDCLRGEPYDLVIDTQGLIKSALVCRLIKSVRCGFDWSSAREPIASLLYDFTRNVDKTLHAVDRNRQLAAKCLGYEPTNPLDYGLNRQSETCGKYALFLHATSRDEKLWSEENWVELGGQLSRQGLGIVLPWGSDKEKERSERLAGRIPGAIVPQKMSLNAAATLIRGAKITVGVDTGLSHLAAATNTPIVGIYCATDPGLTGILSAGNGINLGGKNHSPDVRQVLAAVEQLGK